MNLLLPIERRETSTRRTAGREKRKAIGKRCSGEMFLEASGSSDGKVLVVSVMEGLSAGVLGIVFEAGVECGSEKGLAR